MSDGNNIGNSIAQALQGVYGYGCMEPMSEAELLAAYAGLGITPKPGLNPNFTDEAVRDRFLKNPTGLPDDS